jgi:D-alanyl-D-alanine dipeptidase
MEESMGHGAGEGATREGRRAPGHGAGAAPEYDASDFVVLTQVVPDVIEEIRYFGTYNFLGRRFAGYEQPCALVTREAAQALRRASDEFVRLGYRLRVYDTYRPQRAVDGLVAWALDAQDTVMKRVFYPNVDKERLFELDFVARRSRHSHGSTADVTLFDVASGHDVDMGSPFDLFDPVSHAECTGLTERQVANRHLLRDVMLASGFEGLYSEWWHFTLVDEPYPDTFFDFPVRADVAGGIWAPGR